VFDFFYPLPRLNLATFYSDELQGYGYADLLKKPNFALGALKSQSKLTKKAMRDTAGSMFELLKSLEGDLPALLEHLQDALALLLHELLVVQGLPDSVLYSTVTKARELFAAGAVFPGDPAAHQHDQSNWS